MRRTALYPGTFDPVTQGHMDIITRGAMLFDRLTVVVAANIEKKTLFDAEERMAMIRQSTAHFSNVDVCMLQGLLVEYARRVNAGAILRGLRAVSDFEYEFQMAGMNRKLAEESEGGDVTPFVPAHIVPALLDKLRALPS